jgi:acyl-CoA reductase-like NAD-dependent aldehyde dehydrogenase
LRSPCEGGTKLKSFSSRPLVIGYLISSAHYQRLQAGYEQSGYGKEMSLYSIEEYTNVKHVMAFLE